MNSKLDLKFNQLAELLAQSTSRRAFLVKLTKALMLFGTVSSFPLLPLNRIVKTTSTANAQTNPTPCPNCGCPPGKVDDPMECNHWAYCGLSGRPCATGCCGGTAGSCPAGSDIGGCWIGSCQDCGSPPKVHTILYRDCCVFVPPGCMSNCKGCGMGRAWCTFTQDSNRCPRTLSNPVPLCTLAIIAD